MVVTDEHVGPLYADAVGRSLAAAGFNVERHVIRPGDQSKALVTASQLYDRLAAGRYGRDSTLLALGGGVVSDLTGFVAATWMRGTGFAVCPTSLEGAIDASIGGKTAVNHPAGKNLIGVFYQPRVVVIDPHCLGTLPRRDLVAGLAESVKHAVIRDPDFLEWHRRQREAILQLEPQTLETLIERNVRIKADVVAPDERERTGLRAILNFGHTVGHAIEAGSDYERRHGECVALGMVVACRLSVRMGLLDADDEQTVVAALAELGLPTALGSAGDTRRLMDYVARDKKATGRRVRYVLLEGLGRPVMRDDVPDEAVVEVLHSLAGA